MIYIKLINFDLYNLYKIIIYYNIFLIYIKLKLKKLIKIDQTSTPSVAYCHLLSFSDTKMRLILLEDNDPSPYNGHSA